MTDERVLQLFKDVVKLYRVEKPGQLWANFNKLSLEDQKDFINVFKGLITFHAISEKQRKMLADISGTKYVPKEKPDWLD